MSEQRALTRDIRVWCQSCFHGHIGLEAWNKANTPPLVPVEVVDPDTVTFKDFTFPMPDGGFVTSYKRWYVVCVCGELPHLIDGMTGERVELKP